MTTIKKTIEDIVQGSNKCLLKVLEEGERKKIEQRTEDICLTLF